MMSVTPVGFDREAFIHSGWGESLSPRRDCRGRAMEPAHMHVNADWSRRIDVHLGVRKTVL